MKIYHPPLFLIFLITSCITGNAQGVIPNEASEEKLSQHIFFLASDSLRGRDTASPEINIAAAYLKDHLQNMNLSSLGEGFYQTFTLTSKAFNRKDSFISIRNKKGKKKQVIKRFIPLNQTAEVIDIEGEMVFAGFGLQSRFQQDSDEIEKMIKGKIVLYSAGSPHSLNPETTWKWNHTLEQRKIKNMLDAGAKAIVLVTSIKDTANREYQQFEKRSFRQHFTLNPNKRKEQSNVFIVTPKTAEKLTGMKMKWDKVLKSFSDANTAGIVNLKNNRIHIYSVVEEIKVKLKNVIGIVEGSDSLLKNECIVFMAHYDHLGTRENNVIYNGADDNASGVATLLEVARMFSLLPEKPKRSILFLFPTAEEPGLFGSEYYSRHPVIPMNITMACINLDMVGRVYEERDSVWKRSSKQVKDFDGIYTLINDFSPELKAVTTAACANLELKPDFSLPGRFFYTSDHYHFHKNGVPVLNLSTGYTADYHKPTDTAERIRIDKMKRVVHLCFLIGIELGNRE